MSSSVFHKASPALIMAAGLSGAFIAGDAFAQATVNSDDTGNGDIQIIDIGGVVPENLIVVPTTDFRNVDADNDPDGTPGTPDGLNEAFSPINFGGPNSSIELDATGVGTITVESENSLPEIFAKQDNTTVKLDGDVTVTADTPTTSIQFGTNGELILDNGASITADGTAVSAEGGFIYQVGSGVQVEADDDAVVIDADSGSPVLNVNHKGSIVSNNANAFNVDIGNVDPALVTITNQVSGTITGDSAAVNLTTSADGQNIGFRVRNTGLMSATGASGDGDALQLDTDLDELDFELTNRPNATLIGNSNAVQIEDTSDDDMILSVDFDNEGLVEGTNASAVLIRNAGSIGSQGFTVLNQTGGTVQGGVSGFNLEDNAEGTYTFTNEDGATVTGLGGAGISITDTADDDKYTVVLDNAGSIGGSTDGLDFGVSSIDLTLTNTGTIDGTAGSAVNIGGDIASASATVNIDNASGLLTGGTDGVTIADAAGSDAALDVDIENASAGPATITGVSSGINIDDNGVGEIDIVNNAQGTISGGVIGIRFFDSDADAVEMTIENDGTISGGLNGIDALGDGLDFELDNTGTITGVGFDGVFVGTLEPIDIENAATGLITGLDDGIDFDAGGGTIVNDGTITGTTDNGIEGTLADSTPLVIDNNAGGGILGIGGDGILLDGDDVVATVSNDGTITGGTNGVSTAAEDNLALIVDNNTGTITGAAGDGINVTDPTGSDAGISVTVDNATLIRGGDDGIEVSDNGPGAVDVTNETGATIEGVGDAGIEVSDTDADSLTVDIINEAGATITGANEGVDITGDGVLLSLNNAGQIIGTAAEGVSIESTEAFDIENTDTGTISGGTDGIGFAGTENGGVIDNAGLIEGLGGDGIQGDVADDGEIEVINEATGTIIGTVHGIDLDGADIELQVTNDGLIEGTGGSGIVLDDDMAAATATVDIDNDTGTIDGGAGDGVSIEDAAGSDATLDVDINNAADGAATITGSETGIDIVNNGEGDVSIRNNSQGVINGDTGDGINIEDNDADAVDVEIDNENLAEITGDQAGVDVSGEGIALALDNSGEITGANAQGVHVDSAQELDIKNDATGEITGGTHGIEFENAANGGLIENDGRIEGQGGDGILGDVATDDQVEIENDGTGEIIGTDDGIDVNGADIDLLVNNDGTITGGNQGVELTDDMDTVTLDLDNSTGTITGNAGDGVSIEDAAGSDAVLDVNIDNASGGSATIIGATRGIDIFDNGPGTVDFTNGANGVVDGTAVTGFTVEDTDDDAVAVTVDNSGDVLGGLFGVIVAGDGMALELDNSGSIDGAAADGILLITEQEFDIDNELGGNISGGDEGIEFVSPGGVINNDGTIAGAAGDGIEGDTGGSTGSSGGAVSGHPSIGSSSSGMDLSIDNTGDVTGGSDGIELTGDDLDIDLDNTGSGLIEGSGGDGVELLGGSSTTAIIDNDGSIIGSTDGLDIDGADIDLTLTNDGLIEGTGGSGVVLNDDMASATATVDIDNATGTISGGVDDGISIEDAAGSDAGLDVDIENASGGSATITGGTNGIDIVDNGTGTVDIVNNTDGLISGGTGDGVNIEDNDADAVDVTLDNDGTITGGANGVDVSGDGIALDLDNSGTITGTGDDGVQIDSLAALDIVNESTGVITGGGDDGIDFDGAAGGAITNDGTITGAGVFGEGIEGTLGTGDLLEIDNTGSISGGSDGIDLDGTDVNVAIESTGGISGALGAGVEVSGDASNTVDIDVNSGSVTGGIDGISIFDGGGDSNATLDVDIDNATSITGGTDGINIVDNGAGTVDIANTGTITGTAGDGVSVSDSDADAVAVTLDNDGEITGGTDGVDIDGDGIALDLDNSGTITGTGDDGVQIDSLAALDIFNESTGVITGSDDGIDFDGAAGGVITNDGTITGTTGSGIEGTLGTGDLLTIDNNNTITGGVNGIDLGGTDVNVLVTTNSGISGSTGDGIEVSGDASNTVDIDVNSGSVTGGIDGISIFDQGGDSNATLDVDVDNASTITGGDDGIDIVNNGAGTVDIANTGTITGTTGDGVAVKDNDADAVAVTLDNDGDISGATDGVDIEGDGIALDLDNSGSITGGSDSGVEINSLAALDIVNESTGVITGDDNGIDFNGAAGGAITNDGTITGTTGDGIEGTLGSADLLTITNSGSISGADEGIALDDTDVNVAITNNGGNIAGGSDDGIDVSADTVTADITVNGGSVTGADEGIEISGETSITADITVNAGTVDGGSDGIQVFDPTGSDAAIDITIDNFANITGAGGIDIFDTGPGTIDITNNSTGLIGGGAGGAGIAIFETDTDVTDATIDNDGTISGTAGVAIGEDGFFAGNAGETAIALDLDNSGTITGSVEDGVAISSTRALDIFNESTGVIEGQIHGIDFFGAAGGVITNDGTITGTTGSGIEGTLGTGDLLTIDNNNTITGGVNGIDLGGTDVNVLVTTNSGISGSTGDGIEVSGDASNTVDIDVNSGSVTGGIDGISIFDQGGDSNATLDVDVDNASTITGGDDGIDIVNNGAGTVDIANTGTITGTTGDGVAVKDNDADAVAVTLDNDGDISGATDGVDIEGDGIALDLDNSGSILGGSDEGVEIDSLAALDIVNESTGVIIGDSDGIDFNGAAGGVITNDGTITGTNSDGIGGTLGTGDLLTIDNNNTITGGDDGIDLGGTDVNVLVTTNSGISGSTGDGIEVSGDASNTVDIDVNSGSVTGADDGIQIFDGGGDNNATLDVDIDNASSITGGDRGIEITGNGAGDVDIDNTGTITGSGSDGILVRDNAGNAVTVGINNTEVITGNDNGVLIEGSDVTLTLVNSDLITGTNGDGVRSDGGDDTVTNQTGGEITGGDNGVVTGLGDDTVTNQSGATITGQSGVGVYTSTVGGPPDADLVDNSGTIFGQTKGVATGSDDDTVNNFFGATITGNTDIGVDTGDGNDTVNNDGVIQSNGGANAINTGDGNDFVFNDTTSVISTSGVAINTGGGDDEIQEFGEVNSGLFVDTYQTGAGDDLVELNTGADFTNSSFQFDFGADRDTLILDFFGGGPLPTVFNLEVTEIFGNAYNFGTNNAFTSTESFSLFSGAELDVTQTDVLTTDSFNVSASSSVDLQDPGTDDILDVNPDSVAGDSDLLGTIFVDLDSAANTQDEIQIGGDVTVDGTINSEMNQIPHLADSFPVINDDGAAGSTFTDAGVVTTDVTFGPGLVLVDLEPLVIPGASLNVDVLDVDATALLLNNTEQDVFDQLIGDDNPTTTDALGQLTDVVEGPDPIANSQDFLQALGGAPTAGLIPTSFETTRDFTANMLSCPQATGAPAPAAEGQCAFAVFEYRNTDFDPGNFQPIESDVFMASLGAQIPVAPNIFVGGSVGYARTDANSDASNFDEDRGNVGLVVKYVDGPLKASLAGTFGFGQVDSSRQTGTGATARGEFDTQAAEVRARVSYTVDVGMGAYIEPSVGAAGLYARNDGFTETGGGGANLRVSETDETVFSVTPAVEIGGDFQADPGVVIRPFLRGGVNIYSDDDVQTSATLARTPNNLIRSDTPYDDVVGEVNAGATVLVDNTFSLSVEYQGAFSSDTTQHGGQLKGTFNF